MRFFLEWISRVRQFLDNTRPYHYFFTINRCVVIRGSVFPKAYGVGCAKGKIRCVDAFFRERKYGLFLITIVSSLSVIVVLFRVAFVILLFNLVIRGFTVPNILNPIFLLEYNF